MSASSDEPLLQVSGLSTSFGLERGVLKAVRDVSFELGRGEVLGIVGESGSGKSVTCLSLLGLLPRPRAFHPSGSVRFGGRELLGASERELRSVRGNRIAMVFQDPMTSLNPYLTIARQLGEVLETHRGLSPSAARARSLEALVQVGIADPERRLDAYPHELSGGMRQRVMIAMAVLCEPEILLADEPTTALDVTVQAQILALIEELRSRTGMGIVLVTHDLGVLASIADRVLVMYAGRIVESASAQALFAAPRHPYSSALLRSVPRLGARGKPRLPTISGTPPDLARLPLGCAFAPRCGRAQHDCVTDEPLPSALASGCVVRCHHPEPVK